MLAVPFCFVLLGLLASLIPEAQGHCRNLRFTGAPIHGYRLNNNVIRTIGVSNEDFCQMQCLQEPNCVSYNFKKNGENKCDLNSAAYEQNNEHSGDLAKNENYMYREAENACATKPCKNNATCQAGFTDRDYQCLCISGFTGHDCENDVDECTNGTHNCDVNAVCNNTRGSYNCTCKDGFYGDGINCTDIDECANGTHSCDVNAVCNNTRGSHNCTCKDGFYGDGINCTDIDECANTNPPDCDANAVCTNTQGSYVCTCKLGFYKDGENCTRFVTGECDSPMGMENGNISDSALKAFSELKASNGPSKGRLNHHTTYIAKRRNKGQWIQVDLGKVAKVTKIGTQGRHHHHAEWVSKYTVSYSVNGGYFENQLHNSSDVRREYNGNMDNTNLVINSLDEPIIARYIRIHPTAWHGHISMRLELYGCYLGFTTTKAPTCMGSLGLENNDIPDLAITAASERSSYKPNQGRLHQQSGWAAYRHGTEQWFQVDFVNRTKLTGVAIQGNPQRRYWWVTKFKLAYSYDGEFFSDYREDGDNAKVFEGNTDRFLVVSHLLKNPINVTRYIRIYPVAWNERISLRADFYGCKSEMEIPQTMCASPLGMENKKIPDSAIVASSRRDNHGPEQGRLNNHRGWISQNKNTHQFLQIDLENVTNVTRIATQGVIHNKSVLWTKTYTLDYSEDGGTFVSYHNDQVLQGNTDEVRTEGRILDPPIIARFIKISVKTYQERPSLRVELYGCSDECQDALGMESRAITDAQITASSEYNAAHAASYARLNFQEIPNQAAGAWVASANDDNQWLQVDLGAHYTKVTRIATQGRNSQEHSQWVTEYKLQYRDKEEEFQFYREPGQDMDEVFAGNTDQDSVVYHDLNPPITSQYIRFVPVEYRSHISMRVELYGCLQVKPRPVTICETQNGTISCQNGKRIDVLNANYGRLDQHTCLHERMSDINCRSVSSLQIIKDKCNGKTECQLRADSSVFGGDPCGGTYKYLKVKYRCLEYIGWYSGQPGRSCKHIRDSGGSRGNGEYWIDPEKSGNPLKVFCDMTTDAGGWLLVSNFVIQSSSSTPQLSVETSYRGISNYHNNKMFLTMSAMNELWIHSPFTQLRFHCSKQHGRTFHVTTVANSTGEAVVQYFSGQTDVQPDACGSFVRMENDNSELAGRCRQWGYDGVSYYVGKWGHARDQDRLYNHGAFIANSNHWLLTPGGSRWECDDYMVGVSTGDFWEVFVR